MHWMRLILAAMAAVLAPHPHGAAADPLRIIYIERPPYYYTHNGIPTGVLVERTRTILAEAGITSDFVKMPAKRVIREIQDTKTPACSIGWFKTAERTAFAAFTLPIYQNRPLVALTTADSADRLRAYPRLAELMAGRELVLGVINGFSYGTVIDRMIARQKPVVASVTGTQVQLMRMLAAGRIDYLLAAPEAIAGAAKAAGLDPDRMEAVTFPDVPPGNLRYLMCSRQVPDDVIDEINRAILRIKYHRGTHRYPDPVWEVPEGYRP